VMAVCTFPFPAVLFSGQTKTSLARLILAQRPKAWRQPAERRSVECRRADRGTFSVIFSSICRRDIQHNDALKNDTRQNDIRHTSSILLRRSKRFFRRMTFCRTSLGRASFSWMSRRPYLSFFLPLFLVGPLEKKKNIGFPQAATVSKEYY
jgi:hypothetical protein